jgi:NAD-dependent dihydropyrimidine dehydrogenase PreA subunit
MQQQGASVHQQYCKKYKKQNIQMIRIDNKSNCCGCTACESVCTHDAITMQPDALGFLYPVVDAVKCVECGLCETHCPQKIAIRDHLKKVAETFEKKK